MHRITSLEHLGTLILCKKKMKRMQAHICLKASFSVRKNWLMKFLELEYMLFAMQKTDFNVLELF